MFRILAMAASITLTQHSVRAADLQSICAASGNDDIVRSYDPALRAEVVRAFLRLFPTAHQAPSDPMLAAQARFRCMGGRIYACFLGANLPCEKLQIARGSPGADNFCRDHPDADSVPMYATGHDTIYAYRCRNGQAVVDRQIWDLDARGFARALWTPLE